MPGPCLTSETQATCEKAQTLLTYTKLGRFRKVRSKEKHFVQIFDEIEWISGPAGVAVAARMTSLPVSSLYNSGLHLTAHFPKPGEGQQMQLIAAAGGKL